MPLQFTLRTFFAAVFVIAGVLAAAKAWLIYVASVERELGFVPVTMEVATLFLALYGLLVAFILIIGPVLMACSLPSLKPKR